MGKSEFGLYGVVGGMMVVVLLAFAMRRGHGGIAAREIREDEDGMHSPVRVVDAGEVD